jgi:hypothetical protein
MRHGSGQATFLDVEIHPPEAAVMMLDRRKRVALAIVAVIGFAGPAFADGKPCLTAGDGCVLTLLAPPPENGFSPVLRQA